MTNILQYNSIVIFSFPRAGTKLLAKILQSFNYHDYGEWYDVWTSEVNGNSATRLPTATIDNNYKEADTNPGLAYYKNTLRTIERKRLFNHVDKSVIRIWPENFESFPFLSEQFKNYYWILPQRNTWDQLLSWCVSKYNINYDGKIISNSITIRPKTFEWFYWKLQRTIRMQQWILENKTGSIIQFEKLINKTYSGFGQSYELLSEDEHVDIESFIINLDEIRQQFLNLEKSKFYFDKYVY